MMPHVIRNENPDYCDFESALVMDSKGVFETLDNDFHRMTENLLWKGQSLKSLCAEQ